MSYNVLLPDTKTNSRILTVSSGSGDLSTNIIDGYQWARAALKLPNSVSYPYVVDYSVSNVNIIHSTIYNSDKLLQQYNINIDNTQLWGSVMRNTNDTDLYIQFTSSIAVDFSYSYTIRSYQNIDYTVNQQFSISNTNLPNTVGSVYAFQPYNTGTYSWLYGQSQNTTSINTMPVYLTGTENPDRIDSLNGFSGYYRTNDPSSSIFILMDNSQYTISLVISDHSSNTDHIERNTITISNGNSYVTISGTTLGGNHEDILTEFGFGSYPNKDYLINPYYTPTIHIYTDSDTHNIFYGSDALDPTSTVTSLDGSILNIDGPNNALGGVLGIISTDYFNQGDYTIRIGASQSPINLTESSATSLLTTTGTTNGTTFGVPLKKVWYSLNVDGTGEFTVTVSDNDGNIHTINDTDSSSVTLDKGDDNLVFFIKTDQPIPGDFTISYNGTITTVGSILTIYNNNTLAGTITHNCEASGTIMGYTYVKAIQTCYPKHLIVYSTRDIPSETRTGTIPVSTLINNLPNLYKIRINSAIIKNLVDTMLQGTSKALTMMSDSSGRAYYLDHFGISINDMSGQYPFIANADYTIKNNQLWNLSLLKPCINGLVVHGEARKKGINIDVLLCGSGAYHCCMASYMNDRVGNDANVVTVSGFLDDYYFTWDTSKSDIVNAKYSVSGNIYVTLPVTDPSNNFVSTTIPSISHLSNNIFSK